LPTVHSAVLPAVTPDSATDFFGLNAPVFGVLLSASLISCLQKAWWGFLTGILKRKERASRDIAC
jgi:hypothetical protein